LSNWQSTQSEWISLTRMMSRTVIITQLLLAVDGPLSFAGGRRPCA
jgi:hypothetical protein